VTEKDSTKDSIKDSIKDSTKDSTTEVLNQDGWFRVHLTADSMEAFLTLEQPSGEGKWPTKADALAVLRDENIVFGVDEEVIEHLVQQRPTGSILVARGRAAEPGMDAEIKLFFEIGSIWKFFTEETSDKVDFREVQTIQNVTAGQVIGEKIPATQGKPGCNVLGREILPQNGKDKSFKLGKNAAWTEDGLKIISKIDGEPSSARNQINVNPVHEIRGNVDFKSGNIKFLGSLVIHGNVDSGFRVEAEGDITIHGGVEAAELKVDGNIVIRGGVTGMDKCFISCGGDFAAKYVEHAKIDCGGSVMVKEAIMHCEVNAERRVVVETGKGLIVGGVIRAGDDIAVKTIGSRFGTVTELEAGTKPKLQIEAQELEGTLQNARVNLEKSEKVMVLLERIPRLPPDRQAMYQDLLKTTLALKEQITTAEARQKEIIEETLVISKVRGRVKVKDTLYPGVRVEIAGAVLIIRDEYQYSTLVYNEGEVQIQPYR
jgi:uncharacterized protein (DUF342 family)